MPLTLEDMVRMKTHRIATFLLLIAGITLSFAQTGLAESPKTRIMVVSSYHKEYLSKKVSFAPWTIRASSRVMKANGGLAWD